jgi:hypothetical protein
MTTLPSFSSTAFVVFGVLDIDHTDAHEAVAACDVAAGEAEHLAVDDAAVVHQHQSVHRAHELWSEAPQRISLATGSFFSAASTMPERYSSMRPPVLIDAGDEVVGLAVVRFSKLRDFDSGMPSA